jgi:antitoxin PrlF
MATATVTSKGQVTIPVKVRRALGIKAGTRVDFVETGNGRIELRAKIGSIIDMRGCLPELGYVPTIEEMDEAIGKTVVAEYLAGLADDRNENEDSGKTA